MDKIYICSPFQGDTEHNTEDAKRYCRFALEKGVMPIAPHLLFPQFLDDTKVEERELGMAMAFDLLKSCKQIWVFGSEITDGMTKEIFLAEHSHYRSPRYFDEKLNETDGPGGKKIKFGGIW